MAKRRTLVEGLEDRILLNGVPVALLNSGGVAVEAYGTRVTGRQAPDTGRFSLPKFNTRGGTRQLLAVRFSVRAFTERGRREFDNGSVFAGTVQSLSHRTNVDLRSQTTPHFDTDAVLARQITDRAVGANEDAPAFFDFVPGEGDFLAMPLTGLFYPPGRALIRRVPRDDVGEFVRSPESPRILFTYASSEQGGLRTDGIVGATRYNPDVQFGFVATVVYVYAFRWFGPIPDRLYGGPKRIEEEPELVTRPTIYSGTAEPGATLLVGIHDARHDLIGSQSVIVDAGGNWLANFPDVVMDDGPHSLTLRQTYPNYSASADAGYNLRTYYAPAYFGGTFISEHVTVEDVLGRREAANAVTALYQASVQPIQMGWHGYSYEFLSIPATGMGY